ncbi:divalent-cation tolerance protein CutA [bacterium]|nr:divalent-cation tolerance protein CutA [bacterium]
MTDKCIVLVSAPDKEIAKKIAEVLIIEKLAACVSIIPEVFSIYEWGNKIEKGDEVLMIIKTRVDVFEKLSKRITSFHPYQVPEMLSIPIERGYYKYLQWMDDVLGTRSE